MTFEEKLATKASEQLEYVQIADLGDSIEAKVFGEPIFKEDKRQQECLYITLKLKDGKGVIQKYTRTSYKPLQKAILDAGGITTLQNDFCNWTKLAVGRAINKRYYPEPKPKRR